MSSHDLQANARLISQVATEAAEEPDAIQRHPEVVDAVEALAGRSGLNALFGSNGHDPDAFVRALATGMKPYREIPLTDDPELVENMGVLGAALRGEFYENGHHA
jgi:hypothetical protein